MRGLNHRGRTGGQRGSSLNQKPTTNGTRNQNQKQEHPEKSQSSQASNLDTNHFPPSTAELTTKSSDNVIALLSTSTSSNPTTRSSPVVEDITLDLPSTTSKEQEPANQDLIASESAPSIALQESPQELEEPQHDVPKSRSKHLKPNIQLFPGLPDATTDAEATFETLTECTYLNKSIGNSGQDEAMTCDCKQENGEFDLIPF